MTDPEQQQQQLQDLGFSLRAIALIGALNLDYLGPCPEKHLPAFKGKQGSNVTLFTQTETVRQFVCTIDPKDGTEGVMWALIEAGREEMRAEIAAPWDLLNRKLKPR